MFNSGDHVVYGNNGVCIVENVGTVNLSGINKESQYYTLIPLYSRNSKVFAPVDNVKTVIRKVISKNEALDLLDNLISLELVEIDDYKKREEYYKKVIHDCECVELIRIIKTLYLNKQTRIAQGKKNTALDEKYLRLAQENLYGELAVALDIEKSGVIDVISKKVNI
jgi:CarD family transcriptional regulator